MDANGNAGGERGDGRYGRSGSPPSSGPQNPPPAADSFLAALANLLIQKSTPEQIAALVLEEAKRLTDSPHGYVGYVDADSGRLICPTLTDDIWERCRVAGRRIDLDNFRGLLGWVRQHRQPLVSNHPADDPRAVGAPPGHLAIERLLSVPVCKDEKLLGQISLANARRDYDAQDVAALERVAELFALTLRRRLDELELERTCRELDAKVLERTGHLHETRQHLQRETAQRLRAEQDLESFFLTAPDILAVLGPDGVVKRISPSSEKILGRSMTEMVGAPSAGLIHPDDRAALSGHLRSLAQGGKVLDQELRLRRGDGSWVWISWSGMLSPDGQAVYAVGRDISRRKGFEQALVESEHRFRLAFENSPMGVALIDRQGRFMEVNASLGAMLGYAPAEMRGLTFAQITHAEDRQAGLEGFAQLLAGAREAFSQEKRYLRKDGGVIWGLLTTAPVRDDQGGLLYVVSQIIDITARKQAEEALRESEEKFAKVFQAAPMWVVIASPETGRYLDANDTFLVETGLAREEVLGRTSLEIGIWATAEEGETAARKFREEGRLRDYPASFRTKFGEIRRCLVSTEIIPLGGRQALLSVAFDTTERLRAEEALRESEQRFRLVSSLAPAGIYLTDAQGSCVYVNEEWQRITGMSMEQATGDGWARALHPEDRRRVLESWSAALAAGARFSLDYRYQTADGKVRWVYGQAEPLRGPQGETTGYLGTSIDITERKALEEQARQAQKRESLAVMAGGVAHDFNNLLQTILGNADLALMDAPPHSPMAENLREVQGAAQRAAELAHKMLAYSGHTPFIPRALDLSELVGRSLLPLRQGLPASVALEHHLATRLPALEGDAGLLRQALQNLVANAAEALESGPGVIAVSTGVQECDRLFLDSTYLGHGLAPGRYVFLRVDDSGPGMDQDTVSKAFDPFFTTKFPGRGLGLAVVLGVVRAHRGAVRIEPRPGGGSRVSLYLPASPPASSWERPAGDLLPAAPLVLLVDDEEAVRLVTRRMLERHGLSVLTAGDGPQALEIMRQRAGEIGVVLLDLNMPGPSGEGLVRRIMALDAGARVVVASSLEQSEAEASLGSCPVAGFIQKPYRMASLIELLRRALGPSPAKS